MLFLLLFGFVHKYYINVFHLPITPIIFSDINECGLATDDCDQLCVNDLGSYHCECYTGYFRDNNLSSCVG